MSENMNEIAVIDAPLGNLGQEIASLESGVMEMFSSIQADTFAGKLANLKAVSDSSPISENLKKTIKVKDLIIQKVDMIDEESGELKAQPRVILVSEDGKAYHGISNPLYRDVKNILMLVGHPSTWEHALPIQIEQAGTGTRKYFTLKLAV